MCVSTNCLRLSSLSWPGDPFIGWSWIIYNFWPSSLHLYRNGIQPSQGEMLSLSIQHHLQIIPWFLFTSSHIPPKVLSGCFVKKSLPFYLRPKKTSQFIRKTLCFGEGKRHETHYVIIIISNQRLLSKPLNSNLITHLSNFKPIINLFTTKHIYWRVSIC